MKKIIPLAIVIVFCACKKEELVIQPVSEQTMTVENAASLAPLKYHATSFVTGYPVVTAQVAPFTFTKTLYPESRVESLRMTSRTNPKVPRSIPTPFSAEANYDWNYHFSYGVQKAIITGSVTDIGILPKYAFTLDIGSMECRFNTDGSCTSIMVDGSVLMSLTYSGKRLVSFYCSNLRAIAAGGVGNFDVATNAAGDITKISKRLIDPYGDGAYADVRYTYNTSVTGNCLYQPTQYVLSYWFSLLEVMQWGPVSRHERKSVALNI